MAFDATLQQTTTCCDCNACNDCLGKRFRDIACGSGNNAVSRLASGQHLFRAGDAVTGVYVLRSGALKTYVTSADGEEQILAFHSAGDIIGLDSMGGGRHSRSTVTLSAAEVCRLPVEALSEACARDRVLQQGLLEGMSREIQRLQSMLRLERMTADQRIAFFLLSQARRQLRGSRAVTARTVQLPMSRGEIGRFLDLATETVSRCLTRLQAGGSIRISRNDIELLDPIALQEVAQPSVPSDRRLAA